MSWKLFSLVRSGKDDVNFDINYFKCLEEFSSTELNISFQKLLKLQTQFLSGYRAIPIINFILVEFWWFVVFEELIHFFYVVEFMKHEFAQCICLLPF